MLYQQVRCCKYWEIINDYDWPIGFFFFSSKTPVFFKAFFLHHLLAATTYNMYALLWFPSTSTRDG